MVFSERYQQGIDSLTVNRLRPRARRAERTLRPFAVAIRVLNPCLLRRLRLDG